MHRDQTKASTARSAAECHGRSATQAALVVSKVKERFGTQRLLVREASIKRHEQILEEDDTVEKVRTDASSESSAGASP